MPHATTYAELRDTPIDDLVRLYDETAQHTEIGLNFLREEIARRDAERETRIIVAMTKQMRSLTIFIAVLTAMNVVAAVVLLFK